MRTIHSYVIVAAAIVAAGCIAVLLLPGSHVSRAPSPEGAQVSEAPETQASPGGPGVGPITPRSSVDTRAESRTTSMSTTLGGLDIRVQERDGTPVAGAAVLIADCNAVPRLGSESSMRQELERARTATAWTGEESALGRTGANGQVFVDAGFAPSERIGIAASEGGRAIVIFGVRVRSGEITRVILTMDPTMVFFGRILGASNEPLDGLTVKVFRTVGITGEVATAKSLSDGSYRAPAVSGLEFVVRVMPTKGYFGERAAIKDVQSFETSREVNFAMERAPLVEGPIVLRSGEPAEVVRALDELAGARRPARPPYTGMEVALLASAEDPEASPNFRDQNYPTGTIDEDADKYAFQLAARETRFLSLWVGSAMVGKVGIELREIVRVGSPKLVVDWSKAMRASPPGDFLLCAEGEGGPLTEYRVSVDYLETAALSIGPRQQSFPVMNKEGKWRWTARAGRYEITVVAPGYGEETVRVEIRPAPGTSEARVFLRRGEVIEGVVVRPSGEPAPGALVWLRSETAGADAHSRISSAAHDGSFRFENVRPDTYVLIAAKRPLGPGYHRISIPTSAPRPTIRLSEGLVMSVKPRGAAGPFAMRVVNEEGVAVIDDGADRVSRNGDEIPLYLPAGRYRLSLSCAGFETETREFVAREGAGIDIEMRKQGK